MKLKVLTTSITAFIISAPFIGWTIQSKGTLDPETGIVKAYGTGCSPPNIPVPDLAKAMALEAAQTVAQKNLLETIKGLKLTASTTVENGMLKSASIRKAVEGILQGATECDNNQYKFTYYNGQGIGCVQDYCMQVKLMYDPKSGSLFMLPLLRSLKEQAPKPTPKMEELAKEGEQIAKKTQKSAEYDGIVIDATDVYYEPQMAPYIAYKDASGQLQIIFTPAMLNLGAVSRKGAVAAYATSDHRVKDFLRKWNIKNPLIVKAIDVDPVTGALIVSREDAALISAANAKTHMLEKGNVIIKINPNS